MLIHQKNILVKAHKQQGFTLLEVMIAAFVLAVGMLGSSAMMLRGLQEADVTNNEGIVAQLAMNMAERMRGNITGVAANNYDDLPADSSAPVDCSTTSCNPAGVALYHAYIWGIELEDLLPNANPTARVVADTPGVADSVYRITINWDDDQRVDTETRTTTNKSYVMIFQP